MHCRGEYVLNRVLFYYRQNNLLVSASKVRHQSIHLFSIYFLLWVNMIIAGVLVPSWKTVNTLRPRQNGLHFPDDIFKWIFLNENVWISINISLKFIPRDPMHNIPTLVQVMAWCRPGDKPLFEPMMVKLPTHICVIRPQWVKRTFGAYQVYLMVMGNSFQWRHNGRDGVSNHQPYDCLLNRLFRRR